MVRSKVARRVKRRGQYKRSYRVVQYGKRSILVPHERAKNETDRQCDEIIGAYTDGDIAVIRAQDAVVAAELGGADMDMYDGEHSEDEDVFLGEGEDGMDDEELVRRLLAAERAGQGDDVDLEELETIHAARTADDAEDVDIAGSGYGVRGGEEEPQALTSAMFTEKDLNDGLLHGMRFTDLGGQAEQDWLEYIYLRAQLRSGAMRNSDLGFPDGTSYEQPALMSCVSCAKV